MKRIATLVALGLLLAGCVYGPGYGYYGPGPGYYGPGYYGYAPAYGTPAPATTRALPNGAFGG
jgi:hypothetical protein